MEEQRTRWQTVWPGSSTGRPGHSHPAANTHVSTIITTRQHLFSYKPHLGEVTFGIFKQTFLHVTQKRSCVFV